MEGIGSGAAAVAGQSGFAPAPDRGDWKALLAGATRRVDALLADLSLRPDEIAGLDPHPDFPVRVPDPYLARITPGDPCDPLLLQVLPRRGLAPVDWQPSLDPTGDGAARRAGGLLHKYASRALLITTGACAIHCRYCFRQHFPYAEASATPAVWQQTLSTLAADPTIHELILSGGDPLTLDTPRLARLTDRLAEVPHLRRLRLHTRLPVVLPQRVDAELCRWLAGLPWRVVLVIHANHAREFDDGVAVALARLAATGATLLNQSVLLAGVNDSASALVELSEALDRVRVLPYYLHLLDAVAGAEPFAVPETRARQLHRELQARLPGYLVPRLVRETPGEPSKSWL